MLEYFSLNTALFLPKQRKSSSSQPERQIDFQYYERSFVAHSSRERSSLKRRLFLSNETNQTEIMVSNGSISNPKQLGNVMENKMYNCTNTTPKISILFYLIFYEMPCCFLCHKNHILLVWYVR